MRVALPALLPILLIGCGDGDDGGNMTANQVAAELSGVQIAPGLWEIASEITAVSAPNLPIQVRDRMIGPRQRLRNCITPEQAARPDAGFLAAQNNSACSYEGFAMRGGRMTGTMRCAEPGGGVTVAEMTGDYARDRYALGMTIQTPLPDGVQMRIETRTTGRRIGGCPAPSGGAAAPE